MSKQAQQRAEGRPIWMFMVATAMATTVSTVAATSMTRDAAAEAPRGPSAVTCKCELPEAACAAPEAKPEPAAPKSAAHDEAASEAPKPATPVKAKAKASEPAAGAPAMGVEGSLDKDVIRRIVRAHINEVRYCYNEGLSEDPELAGRVVVKFRVGAKGKVEDATVTQTDIAQTGVPVCIERAVARWRFPKPADGEHVVVTYPFVLEPG